MQADVETVHNLVEIEFYEIEHFLSRQNFMDKAYSYQLFFNLVRTNSYKENKTPWQLAHEKRPDLPISIAMIPPVDLCSLLKKSIAVSSKRGYDVSTVPWLNIVCIIRGQFSEPVVNSMFDFCRRGRASLRW